MKFNENNSFKALIENAKDIEQIQIKDLFDDKNRLAKFSFNFNDFYFDFSKNKINDEIFNNLINLANECGLSESIKSILNADKFNFTENREVLHFALRYNNNDAEKYHFNHFINDNDILVDIENIKQKMKEFTNKVRNGEWLGYTGKPIKYIINIGIGGSDLGPKFVSNALHKFNNSDIKTFYVSNIDPTDLIYTLEKVDLEQTLFVIASKTFTTLETISNANLAKSVFLTNTNAETKDIAKHFVALSTNIEKCKEFGIPEENLFAFWDWVGGRFSLWSAIGLSISLTIGWDNFEQLLEGAYKADKHFFKAEFDQNIPVIMALIGVWYRNFLDYSSYAILPYSQSLSMFSEYLQQIEMESNGKYIDKISEFINYKTSPIIWGTAGTNAQHSYFQLLHQGKEIIPADFIAFVETEVSSENSELNHILQTNHKVLLSNFIAQTEALMIGKNYESALKELENSGISYIDTFDLAKHKTFAGNRPSTSILIDKLTPENLGTLIAFYEHKVFVQGVIWNVNSYDQWGVELGKVLAKEIKNDIDKSDNINSHDNSTNVLINKVK